MRLVVLLSGEGTLFQALVDAAVPGLEIVAVGSDTPEAGGLRRAQAAGIETFVVEMPRLLKRGTPERAAWDLELAQTIESYRPDIVLSAGFMKLVGEAFFARFEGRYINTHPALLPAFPGAHAVRDALAVGVTETGCSIFWVASQGVDEGEMIGQRVVPVEPDDDEPILHERIKIAERSLLVDTMTDLAKEHA